MWPSPLQILLLLHAKLCHTTFPVSITLKNPYGYLDALDYPLMVFYAVILVGYVLLAVVWCLLLCCYCKEIARLQVHWMCIVHVFVCIHARVCMCM